jgi:hypothetical protein
MGSAVHLINPQQAANGLLEGATVILALATILLAWVAHRTRQDASDTARRQLRAYMGVAVQNEINIDNTADYIDIRLVFHNYGATPAYRVHYRGKLEIVNSSTNPDHFEIDVDNTIEYAPRVIQPGAEFGYVARLSINEAQRRKVKIGNEERLYLWGALIYWDAFEMKRYNKFRFYFGGDECVRAKRMFWDGEPDANQAN